MEIKITYDDGRTFVTQVPNGNIANVEQILNGNIDNAAISNVNIPLCGKPKDRFTYSISTR